jgi:signal peptidase I
MDIQKEKNNPPTDGTIENNSLTPIQEKKEGGLKEFVKFVIIAAVIVIPFRMFVAQPFVVNGASMDPTFESGEYLIVDQLTYHFESPKRGSVIIFKYPKDPSKYFIKRIIGLPGDTVIIDNGKVTIKNAVNSDGIILDEPYIEYPRVDSMTVEIKDDEYFVLGDNRAASSDSRVWGTLPDNLIVGRPIVRLLPPKNLSWLPGDYSKISEK